MHLVDLFYKTYLFRLPFCGWYPRLFDRSVGDLSGLSSRLSQEKVTRKATCLSATT